MDVGQGELAEDEANLVRILGANLADYGFLASADGTFEIAKLHHRHRRVGIAGHVAVGPDQPVGARYLLPEAAVGEALHRE